MMNYKISVIVPVYNVEKYIDKCLNSIVNQTNKNLEIILIDDGSTDRSGDICEQYAMCDSRIKVIHQKNQGLSSARNRGLDIASGEYIGFVDSDDWISIDMYQILLTTALKYNADIVECGYEKVYENKEYIIDSNIEITEDKIFILNNIEALHEEMQWGKFTAIACNKLYRKCLFLKFRYPIGKCHEDEHLTYKLLYSCNRLVSINEIKLYYYLQKREGSITAKFTEKNLDIYDAYEEKTIFFYKNVRVLYGEMLNNLLWLIFYLIYQSEIYSIKCKKVNDIYNRTKKNKKKYLSNNIKLNYKLQLLLLVYFRSGFIWYKKIEETIRRIKK